jgi:hypothetical protein
MRNLSSRPSSRNVLHCSAPCSLGQEEQNEAKRQVGHELSFSPSSS